MKIKLAFILSIVSLLIINILDSSLSSSIATIFVYIVGLLFSLRVNEKYKKDSVKLFFNIFPIYLVSAYIFSLSFNSDSGFLLTDPIGYIQQSSFEWSLNKSFVKDYLYRCYFELNDSNALYNLYIRLLANFANSLYGKASVLYLTLSQTFFGILSSTVLFRVLSLYFSSNKAYKYTFAFAVFSLFHFYSSVIVRDVIIAFLYLLVIEIVLKEFSIKNLVKLFFLLLIIWGIRLYSGLYVFIFILYYIYIPIRKTKFKPFILPLFILLIVLIFISSNEIINQSLDEISYYVEFTTLRGEASGGLSSYLHTLPPVIKEIVLTLYSQFHPFPPFTPFLTATTFSHYYMSTIMFINSVWWAFIFYKLLIFLLMKRVRRKIPFEFIILFIISIFFIIANTAHIDVRRMMPVYPILYLIYLTIVNNFISTKYVKITNALITFFTTFAIAVYFYIKA